MFFFFALTLYLLERPNTPKWIPYVTGTLLGGSKLLYIGTAFLIPLLFKRKSLIFCALAAVVVQLLYHPPLVPTAVIAMSSLSPQVSSFLSPLYNVVSGLADIHYSTLWWITHFAPDLITFMLLAGGGVFLIKKYPTEIVFCIITLLYSFGSGLGVSHTSSLIYSGILVFPLVFHHFVMNKLIARKEVTSGTRRLNQVNAA
jgi:hypothetical protein